MLLESYDTFERKENDVGQKVNDINKLVQKTNKSERIMIESTKINSVYILSLKYRNE